MSSIDIHYKTEPFQLDEFPLKGVYVIDDYLSTEMHHAIDRQVSHTSFWSKTNQVRGDSPTGLAHHSFWGATYFRGEDKQVDDDIESKDTFLARWLDRKIQIDFGFKGLKSFLAEDHLERFGVQWGALKYRNTEFEGQTFKVELPFEHFKFERLYNQTGNTSTTVMFGWGADKGEEAYVTEPLLFYPVKVTNVSTGVTNPTDIAFLNGSSKEKIDGDTGYFVPSNSVKLDLSQSLNFSAEMNEYNLRPFATSLFQTYYKTYITDLFKPERRVTKLAAYLPTGVVVKLKLSDRLVIEDRVYKINSIKTNFETNLSDLELINVFDQREPIRNIEAAASNVTASTITIDSTLITIDATSSVSKKVITDIKKVPDTIPENRPKPINNIPCTVTASTLGVVEQQTNTSSTVFFSHAITALGKICEVATIESYGWLFSDTSTTLKSTDDIDTLKAASGITTREFFPKQKTDKCSPKIISNLVLITSWNSSSNFYDP